MLRTGASTSKREVSKAEAQWLQLLRTVPLSLERREGCRSVRLCLWSNGLHLYGSLIKCHLWYTEIQIQES